MTIQKINLKQITATLLNVAFFTQCLFAGNEIKVNPVALSRWSKLSHKWTVAPSATEVEKRLKASDFVFNSKFEDIDKKFVSMKLMQTDFMPSFKAETNKYVLNFGAGQALDMRQVGNFDFVIEGKAFSYNEAQSLEVNAQRLSALFAVTKTSFFEGLFFPQAHAGIGDWISAHPIAAILITIALTAIVYSTIVSKGKNVSNAWGHTKAAVTNTVQGGVDLFDPSNPSSNHNNNHVKSHYPSH